MAFYYVKSGGTATGDGGRYTTQKTGSWASAFTAITEYYGSIEAVVAATTPPAATDTGLVSHLHAHTQASDISYDFIPGFGFFSVDDTAIDQYLAGAKESATGSSSDIQTSPGEAGFISTGISFEVGNQFRTGSSNNHLIVNEGSITLDSTADRLNMGQDGSTIELNGVDLIWSNGSTNECVKVNAGGLFRMIGGSLAATSGTLADFCGGTVSNGGATYQVIGVDLSAITGYLFADIGDALNADDTFEFIAKACQVGGSLTGFVQDQFVAPNQYVLITNCSDTSAASEYQFFQRTWAGDVEDQDDTGIHRDESTAFPNGTKVSMKATTVASCSISRPLIIDLPSRFAELSGASTDTIRVYFAVANTETLTDTNVWAELIYPDGTNKHIYNSLSNRNTDVIAVGTTHTDDSAGSTWLNGVSALTSHNEYYMDLDTSGDVGADSVPIIRIHCGIASTTIYFDTTVDVVA